MLKLGSNKIKQTLTAWLFMLPCIIIFFVFLWQPFFSGLYMSFFKTNGFEMVDFVGFDNYIDVIMSKDFLRSLKNTFMYAFFSLLIGFPIPVVMAIIINEITKGKGIFRAAIYLPSMIPAVVSAILWGFLYEPSENGILNIILTSVGIPAQQWLQDSSRVILWIVVAMTWGGFGPTTILYIADLQSVNLSLYEAASMDGAGFFRKVWNITIPHMRGLMKMFFIMQFISVFQVFEQPLAMSGGGPNGASSTLLLLTYNNLFNNMNVGKASAISGIVSVILVCLSAIYFSVQKKENN